MISSDPAPQIILLKSHLNFFEISLFNNFAPPSGYLDKFRFLTFKTFLTLGLTPKADSFADNFVIFLILPKFDLPGL